MTIAIDVEGDRLQTRLDVTRADDEMNTRRDTVAAHDAGTSTEALGGIGLGDAHPAARPVETVTDVIAITSVESVRAQRMTIEGGTDMHPRGSASTDAVAIETHTMMIKTDGTGDNEAHHGPVLLDARAVPLHERCNVRNVPFLPRTRHSRRRRSRETGNLLLHRWKNKSPTSPIQGAWLQRATRSTLAEDRWSSSTMNLPRHANPRPRSPGVSMCSRVMICWKWWNCMSAAAGSLEKKDWSWIFRWTIPAAPSSMRLSNSVLSKRGTNLGIGLDGSNRISSISKVLMGQA